MDTLRNIRNNPSIALFLRIWFKLAALTLGVGTLLRIVLLFNPQTVDTGFSLGGWMQIFLLGALNDLCVITIAYIFVWLFMLLATEAKYRRPAGYIIFGHLVGLFCYTTFAHNILHEYGSVAPLAGSILTALLAAVFGIKLFFKRVRRPMTLFGFGLLLSIYVCVIVFNVISEYIFWDEFGVRYNFIAVDYLIYTNEVIGNIMESYPIIPLVGIMLAITAGRDMGAVPPRYTSNRPYGGGLALESRRLARLSRRSRRSLRPACLQHALAADAQRLSQRVAGQRSV